MITKVEKQDVLRLSNEESKRITRECLQIAMLHLMDRKPFEKISITELTGEAGVSRTAFYRNYESKEALVEDICEHVLAELKASIHGTLYQTDRRQWYTVFYQTIRKNSDYFRIYLNAHLQFEKLFVLDAIFPPTAPLEHYRNSAREGSFLRILTDWFRGGMEETPEEMGEICAALLGRGD